MRMPCCSSVLRRFATVEAGPGSTSAAEFSESRRAAAMERECAVQRRSRGVMEFINEDECNAKREQGGKRPEKGAWKEGLSNGPVALRKYLQNDEVMDYAFDHSDLFYPFSLQASLSSAEPPKVSEQAQRCGLLSCGRFKARQVVQRQASEYTGFFRFI